jgi:hypothetical protein
VVLSTTAQTFLFRMDVTDPRAFAAAIGVSRRGLIASAIPARRAAVDGDRVTGQ